MNKSSGLIKARPFLKWAGGKTQLLHEIEQTIPANLGKQKNLTYIEPFIGSGAVMFWFLQTYPNLKKAVINDINPDLATAYKVIRTQPKLLISTLLSYKKSMFRWLPKQTENFSFLRKEQNLTNAI